MCAYVVSLNSSTRKADALTVGAACRPLARRAALSSAPGRGHPRSASPPPLSLATRSPPLSALPVRTPLVSGREASGDALLTGEPLLPPQEAPRARCPRPSRGPLHPTRISRMKTSRARRQCAGACGTDAASCAWPIRLPYPPARPRPGSSPHPGGRRVYLHSAPTAFRLTRGWSGRRPSARCRGPRPCRLRARAGGDAHTRQLIHP